MIPVILIHKGYQDYLGCAISQALKNNPVHLIAILLHLLFPKILNFIISMTTV